MAYKSFFRFRCLVAPAAVVLLFSLGCSRQPEPAREAERERAAETPKEVPAPPPAEAAKEAEPAKPAEPPKETRTETARSRLMNPASLNARAPASFNAKFATSKGDFTIQVTRSWAPRGADRFYNLVRNRFYNDARFFRVVPNFVVQFGLPADPQVSQVWSNATFRDDPVTQSNKKGYVVFATAGPNTRTTQLFINLKDNAFLDSQGFAPFGEVTEGMDVVESLYSGYGDAPTERQGDITMQGNAFLSRLYPNLDHIKTATVQP